MDKEYPSRLAYLMARLNLSAKVLAEVLHVDRSLVSKWRNNKRVLSPRSHYLEQMAAYFMQLDAQNRPPILPAIIGEYYPGFTQQPAKIKKALLKKWLLGNFTEKNSENYWQTMQKRGSYTVQFDVMHGAEGRRQASRRFLNLALSLPPGQELLLYSQTAQASWHVEDMNFYGNWKKSQLELQRRGHSVKLIHSIDRELNSLINVLLEWLPMELYGDLVSYYCPKYTNIRIKPTILVVKGRACVVAISHEELAVTECSYFFTDPITVGQAELVLRSLLSQCLTLYHKFPAEKSSVLLETLIPLAELPENCYWYTPLPFVMADPGFPAAFGFAPGQLQETEQYHRLQKSFYQSLKNNRCRIIIPARERDKFFMADSPGSAAHKKVEYLRHLLSLLDRYPNLEIATSPAEPAPWLEGITMLVKENTVTAISSLLSGKTEPATLLSQEPSVVKAYYTHLERVWSEIPPEQKDREAIKAYIRHRINQAE
ncbi:MAG: helix-turn-helix transcriptional regulator [Firmicutes bacterium]|nr:helix-turn-helix transcriptional regulator [Bacillota bacterium]